MPKADYSTWLTKQQAADAIGVSTKTVEQLAKDRKIQAARWKRPETGATIVVYHPGDVQRIREERNPDAEPFVLPAESLHFPSDSKAVAVSTPPQNFMDFLHAVASQNSEKRSEVRLSERLFLSLEQAADYTGLGVGHLRRLIADGKLIPLKGAGPRGAAVIRRADLEKL